MANQKKAVMQNVSIPEQIGEHIIVSVLWLYFAFNFCFYNFISIYVFVLYDLFCPHLHKTHDYTANGIIIHDNQNNNHHQEVCENSKFGHISYYYYF